MYVLSLNMWFQKLMRQFFFNIDSVVFNFISGIYDLLISIARTSVLSQADIIEMADRIYKLLAIFMVFKVTFSLIMYVVNPDDFSDKSKGISKLGTNIIISLTLLILTPYVFNMAYTLQTIVLEDNSIAALIFGDDSGQNEFLNTAGDSMAFIAMRPFFMPNVSIEQMSACTTLDEECFNGMRELISDDGNFTNTMMANYEAGISVANLGLMFRQDLSIATDEENDNFIMDYKYLFSTVIGVVIILLLITFCMDVAVRSIKLAFLQLAAPIPIISYIDPKSGKDGLFKKWYQMCIKTYLSLFIRILALYFAIYIISKVGKMVDIIDGSYQSNALIAIFIIIGALMFAKQLPKILEGLGIKLDGGFQLNPLKKIEKDAIGGKQLVGAARGVAAGAMIGTAGMLTGAGIGRGVSATLGGFKSGLQGKKFGDIRKDQVKKNAEMRRAIASGSTFLGRRSAQLSGYFGTSGRLGYIEHDKMDLQNEIDNLTAKKEKIGNDIAEKQRIIAANKKMQDSASALEKRAQSKIENGEGHQGMEYLKLKARYDKALNDGADEATLASLDSQMKNYLGDIGMKEYMSQQIEYSQLKKVHDASTAKAMMQKKYGSDFASDDAFDTMYKDYSSNATAIGATVETTGDKVHSQLGKSKGETADIQRSIDPYERQIKKIDDDIKAANQTMREYNAQEKTAKSNVEAVHSTPGGPAHPNDIRPAESTVGRRTGGPGSGTGPMGPGGFGPGGPGGTP